MKREANRLSPSSMPLRITPFDDDVKGTVKDKPVEGSDDDEEDEEPATDEKERDRVFAPSDKGKGDMEEDDDDDAIDLCDLLMVLA